MKTKLLIVCTGNTCRSQMAEGFINSLSAEFEVVSAGTKPGLKVNAYAVKVMNEVGIDISSNSPKDVNLFVNSNFDYLITLCSNAKQLLPQFKGNIQNRLYIEIADPADAKGSDEEILAVYRRTLYNIKENFSKLLTQIK